jgi:hypothetical protein
MFHGFSFGIGWHFAQLIFGIACYEVVRYLVLNKLRDFFKNKSKENV